MKLFDLFTEAELQGQIEKKMVKRQVHPIFPLAILNYTQVATFTPEHWNHVTNKCRGIIYDSETLEVVSRPFEKFWNLNDARHPETLTENLPSSPPLLTRKMDGSLGISYPGGIATRGSFSSEQAMWATAWLARRGKLWLEPDATALFEIVYPENQIVVRYPYAGLVLLAIVRNATGVEVDRNYLRRFVELHPYLRLVEEFDRPLAQCAAEDDPNEEGYVASWPRPNATPLRVKIKYETYCQLHRLLTQTNAVTVWEMLRDGQDVGTLTATAPDGFRAWIDGLEKKLRDAYAEIAGTADEALAGYQGERNFDHPASKKAFALYAIGEHKDVAPIMFAVATGKDPAPIIWKMLRPSGDERTFKVDEA